jgi:hypothetical protein
MKGARPLGGFDTINLLVPWAALPLAFLLQLAPMGVGPGGNGFLWRFVVDLIFFDFAHVAVTFALVACVPEIRAMSASTARYRLLLSDASVFAVLAFSGAVYFVLPSLAFLAPGADPMLFTKIYFLLAVTPKVHHLIAQMFGVSRAYREPSPNPTFERLCYNAFVVFYLLQTARSGVREWIPPGLRGVASVLTVFTIAALAGFFWANRRASNRKLFYISRFALWPLSFFFPTLGLFPIAISHSLEYIGLTYRILRRTSGGPAVLRSTIIKFTVPTIGAFAISLWADVQFRDQPIFSQSLLRLQSEHPYVFFGMVVVHALSFGHFYVDRFLFRMRNEEPRKFVAPLFYAESNAS